MNEPMPPHAPSLRWARRLPAFVLILLGGCAFVAAPPGSESGLPGDGGAPPGESGGLPEEPTPGREPGSEDLVGDVTDSGGSTDEGVTGGNGDLQSGTLTAGSFDDNLNPDAYSEFVSEFLQSAESQGFAEFTLGDRAIITVVDDAGEPVGNARVAVTTDGMQQQAPQTLLDVPTRSDGRALYAHGLDGGGDATSFSLTVYPPDGSEPVTASTDLSNLDWTVTLPGVTAGVPSQLDLAFIVDATGSMSDELEYLKVEMDGIAASVADAFPDVDQRYALIVYRDRGDVYVTRTFDFTSSLEAFQGHLSDQFAGGGGDYPEAMHEALEEARALSWRGDDAVRVLFLIADAPPHTEHARRTLDALMALRFTGAAIYPVAASGVADAAEYMMRAAALLTLSEYCFLTDDSGVGNPHAEPHVPCYAVQRLDQLMIRMISGELSGKRIYPEAQDIIRTVGRPVEGVCVDDGGEQLVGQE